MNIKTGYKQTEIGVIPEDWEVKKISECTDYVDYRGKTPKKTTMGRFLVTAKNIRAGYIDYEISKEYVSEDEYSSTMKRGVPLIGDILITTEAPLGNVALIDREDIALAQRVIKYRANVNLLNYGYLKHYFLSEKFQKILDDNSSGSTAKGIKGSVLHKLPIILPPLPEQTAIAAALSDVDALMGELDKLIAKKRDIKQATMQQLLTGKKRLAGFSGEWEVKRLGEIGESLIGLTYKPSDVTNDGVLVLRSSNVFEGSLRFDDNVFVNSEIPERIIVKTGDILICVRNGSRDLIGKCAKIDERVEGMTFGAFMAVFRTEIYDFIFHQFQSDVIKRQIHEHLGATINQITNKSLNSFFVPIPPTKEEQTAIATILSDMDAEISQLEARRAKTAQLKQGMMQELLTGRIRLIGASV